MVSISERIRLILDREKIDNKDAAEWLGITSSRLSQKFKADVWDSLAELKKISKRSGYRLDWIITGQGAEKVTDVPLLNEHVVHIPHRETKPSQLKESETEYMKGEIIRPITVVVNAAGKELIPYVAHRAQAGYARGYGDPQFLEKLPAFSLPIMKDNGTYRMFEVHGDSMLQIGGGGLHDGDVVIAQYVEDFFSIRDNRVYVVVCDSGVIVKRCLNRLKDNEPVLVCNSDNKNGNYKPIIVRPHEMIEVWELKAFISRQLSFSTDLWTMINDLQVQQARINEKVDALEQQKQLK